MSFRLAPYPGLPAPADVRVTGTARREGAILELTWTLEGEGIAIAEPAARPERRHELWATTCFEFFLKGPDHPGYWEFNLSPAGHWNVYRFDGYRAGMRDEAAFSALPFNVAEGAAGLKVTARIDVSGLGLGHEPWRLAISTVVEEADGRVTYWALAHPGAQPDFHDPAAFTLSL